MPSQLFSDVSYSPPDPVFELKAAFDRDTCKSTSTAQRRYTSTETVWLKADPLLAPDKINLGPGAYLDDKGKPWILPAVAAAEGVMASNHPGHEYLPILGHPSFRRDSARVLFGAGSSLLHNPQLATIQTISGTGAVRIAAQFLKLFYSPDADVYVSNPSWSNHRIMFEYSGFNVVDYPYYDDAKRGIDWEGFRNTLLTAKPGSVFILHPCAHNPTGCDPTREQWKELGSIMKERNLVPVLDSAYQGFASGDLDQDGWVIRYLTGEVGLSALVCQSFSKSMGLYGERVGALHVVLPYNSDAELIKNIESQLGWISRKEISTPGRYGATIAATVLGDEKLYAQWQQDLKTMSGRIHSMRQAVKSGLEKLNTPGKWDHVVTQIGMFSYTGLTKEQVVKLKEKHIYMALNGRISVSGLNTGNVDYFCRCVSEVVKATA